MIWHVHMATFFRVVRSLDKFSLVSKCAKHVSKVREMVRRCEKICENDIFMLFMTSDKQKVTLWFLDSSFWTKFKILQPGWYSDRAIKILHMVCEAIQNDTKNLEFLFLTVFVYCIDCPDSDHNMTIFYRAVRNLVDFSLVTKLTKHVSKVRETVRTCEKTRRNDCETFCMTSDSQKNDIAIFGFLFLYKIPDFTTRLIPWPGDKNSPYGKVFLGCHTSHREFAWSTYEEKVTLLFFFDPKMFLKSSNMTSKSIQKVRN